MEVATRRLMRYSLADMDSLILSGSRMMIRGSAGGSPTVFITVGILVSACYHFFLRPELVPDDTDSNMIDPDANWDSLKRLKAVLMDQVMYGTMVLGVSLIFVIYGEGFVDWSPRYLIKNFFVIWLFLTPLVQLLIRSISSKKSEMDSSDDNIIEFRPPNDLDECSNYEEDIGMNCKIPGMPGTMLTEE
eukprot:GHVQ01007098.1.p1 GENE.GHVQ01007098.1~~GHVQ01007098.1.p1  ORF type:complete len:189 (+),score=16.33 GHVQ01007098.1:136-702(+)